MKLTEPRMGASFACGDNDQNRQVGHVLRHEAKQLDRCGVDPMSIFEQQKDWSARCESAQSG